MAHIKEIEIIVKSSTGCLTFAVAGAGGRDPLFELTQANVIVRSDDDENLIPMGGPARIVITGELIVARADG